MTTPGIHTALIAGVEHLAALAHCLDEINIFPDKPKYLAAGGRLSRSSALWDAILRYRPVIAPRATGPEKAGGGVRRRKAQIRFAVERLSTRARRGEVPAVWLQFTDNRAWVKSKAVPAIRNCLPRAELIVQPLSLTTGVHTGPGTWAVAFHPAPATVNSPVAPKQRRFC